VIFVHGCEIKSGRRPGNELEAKVWELLENKAMHAGILMNGLVSFP